MSGSGVFFTLRDRPERSLKAGEPVHLGIVMEHGDPRGGPVVVRTVAGRSHHGRLTAVAADCCVLRTSAGTVTLLPLRAVTSLRHGPGRRHREAATSRRSPVAATFVGLLADLAGERPRVRLACDGNPDVLAGELRAAGADVLTLQQEADPPAIVYVRLASVTEVSLLGSG